MDKNINKNRATLFTWSLVFVLIITLAACGGGGGGTTTPTTKAYAADVVTGTKATPANAQVLVSWQPTSGAASYNLYYSTTSPVTSASTKITGITDTFYSLPSLTNGTTYYYRMTSVDTSAKESSITDTGEASTTPVASSSVPAAPINVCASFYNGQVFLQWDPMSGAVTYNVYWGTTAGITVSSTSNKKGIIGPSVTITGLTNGTAYHFIVTAVNAKGEGLPSAEVIAYPQIIPSSHTPVNTLSIRDVAQKKDSDSLRWIVATPEVKRIRVKWDDEMKSYEGPWKDGEPLPFGLSHIQGHWWVCYSTTLPIDTNTSCVFSEMAAEYDLNPPSIYYDYLNRVPMKIGVPYFITIEEYDFLGNRLNFPIVVATPQYAYHAPTNVTATLDASGTSTTVSWDNAVDDNGHIATSYTIAWGQAAIDTNPIFWGQEVSRAPGGLFSNVKIDVTGFSGNHSSVTINNLAKGNVIVAACSHYDLHVPGYGWAPYPGCDTAEEPSSPAAINALTGVSAAAGNGQLTVSWTAVTGATSYNVYYRTTAGVTTTNGTKVAGAASGGAITGLTNGTTYYFVVTAVTAAGESASSSEVSATPTSPATTNPLVGTWKSPTMTNSPPLSFFACGPEEVRFTSGMTFTVVNTGYNFPGQTSCLACDANGTYSINGSNLTMNFTEAFISPIHTSIYWSNSSCQQLVPSSQYRTFNVNGNQMTITDIGVYSGGAIWTKK